MNIYQGIMILQNKILIPLAILITLLLLSSNVVADDDTDEGDEGMDDLGEGLGTVAAWLLGFTLIYAVWKRALPPLRKSLKSSNQKDLVKKLNKANKKVIPIHTLVGLAALITGSIHGLMMDDSHISLWIAIALMGLLSVSGSLMRWKWPPKTVKKGARLLHMQRAMSIAVVILLFLGHELVD
ncbi:MAG: hypothetical protein HN684_01790 [Euryarchaeota archaeon]|nr:hypothetical protein [Euryarchaeota archaeon]